METNPRTVGGSPRGSSLRRVGALLATAVFVALVVLVALGAAGQIRDLDSRRDEALASRSDGADAAGNAADAFRRFRATLHRGDHFALVFAPGTSIDDQGTHRLVAISYLYPAIAVTDVQKADAVMVFGEPSVAVRSTFAETGIADGVWLGRRRE
jgi:hypothetical protein